MPSFIESCNCKGRTPSGLVSGRHNLRSDITGQLLKDRNVARFIVAPTGFGKSSVAFEYAQLVFAFEEVFWISGKSPCFLRDLDSGNLSDLIFEANPDVRLVVCDDVPHMDQDRSEMLASFIDSMLERRCEVLITCVPSADTFTAHELDSVILRPRDLLLSDTEIDTERSRGNANMGDDPNVPRSKRVPCLIWSDDGEDKLIAGIADEDLPADIMSTIFAMLVLDKGDLEDAMHFIPSARKRELSDYLCDAFPYLGIDFQSDAFESVGADIGKVAKLGLVSGDGPAQGSTVMVSEDMRVWLANLLLSNGKHARACEVIAETLPKHMAVEWLSEMGWRILMSGGALSFARLFLVLTKHARQRKIALTLHYAFATLMLGNLEETRRKCKAVTRSKVANVNDKVIANILLWLTCEADDPTLSDSRTKVEGYLQVARTELSIACQAAERANGADIVFADLALSVFEAIQAYAIFTFSEQASSGESNQAAKEELANKLLTALESVRSYVLSESIDWHFGKSALMLMEAYSIRVAIDDFPNELIPIAARLCDEVSERGDHLEWPVQFAAKTIDDLTDKYPFQFDFKLSLAAISSLRNAECAMESQKAEYRKMTFEFESALVTHMATHPGLHAKGSGDTARMKALQVAIPTLHISVFGGLDCRVGSKAEEPRIFKRKKTQILLVLLALNRGREVTRETITEALWPNAASDVYRKNFYAIWSELKKSLDVDGSCPYLLKSQTGCRLDYRHVSCDIDEFDELCRSLMFGRDDSMLWEDMYAKVSTNFAEDILCGVRNSDYIDETRDRIRTQLVDALISASGRMIHLGEFRGALWFAREAHRRDSTREDAFIALMESQIASNQRGAALETYFACRKYLSDELGIDPSRKVVELYRSIIESEEIF